MPTSSSSTGGKPSGGGLGNARHQLALVVITSSIVGITAAAGLAIWLARASDRPDTTRLIFTSVLPLFGTWVGTVLAFYFARENLQTATDTTLALTGRLQAETPVQQVMIPKSQIQSYDLAAGEDVRTVRLKALYDRMTADRQRIPIFDQAATVLYIVHQSTITSFASSVAKDPRDAQQFTETMADLLNQPDYKAMVEAIGVIGPDAVLADARATMRSVPRCNDVFVTAQGRRTDPVLGWLTNTDLAEIK